MISNHFKLSLLMRDLPKYIPIYNLVGVKMNNSMKYQGATWFHIIVNKNKGDSDFQK